MQGVRHRGLGEDLEGGGARPDMLTDSQGKHKHAQALPSLAAAGLAVVMVCVVSFVVSSRVVGGALEAQRARMTIDLDFAKETMRQQASKVESLEIELASANEIYSQGFESCEARVHELHRALRTCQQALQAASHAKDALHTHGETLVNLRTAQFEAEQGIPPPSSQHQALA